MTDERDDPADAPAGSGRAAAEPLPCANCGARVDVDRWHPVATGTDERGDFRLYAFCSQECRDCWVEP